MIRSGDSRAPPLPDPNARTSQASERRTAPPCQGRPPKAMVPLCAAILERPGREISSTRRKQGERRVRKRLRSAPSQGTSGTRRLPAGRFGDIRAEGQGDFKRRWEATDRTTADPYAAIAMRPLRLHSTLAAEFIRTPRTPCLRVPMNSRALPCAIRPFRPRSILERSPRRRPPPVRFRPLLGFPRRPLSAPRD